MIVLKLLFGKRISGVYNSLSISESGVSVTYVNYVPNIMLLCLSVKGELRVRLWSEEGVSVGRVRVEGEFE